MTFVIFHGSFSSPEGNWFPELAEKLEALGQKVLAPRFPVENWEEITKNGPGAHPKNQNLANWLKSFEKNVLRNLGKNEKLCFIGHSLGPVFILHVVSKYNLQLDSAIFVSPFLTSLAKEWQFDLVNRTFYKTDFNWKRLRKLIPISYTLYSDNDPYVDKKYPIEFAKKMDSCPILVKGGKHLNSESGFTGFSLVFELCKTRLVSNSNQLSKSLEKI